MTPEAEPYKSEQRGIELEYTAVRNEILKRIEMRQQIVAVALTLAGVLLGVGLGKENVSLIYPPLAAFLAIGWAQNDFRIRELARYARNNLEEKMPGLGYERYVHRRRHEKKRSRLESWRFVVLSHGGVFLITQMLAVGMEVPRFSRSTVKLALFIVDLLAMITVVWVMGQSGRKDKLERQ